MADSYDVNIPLVSVFGFRMAGPNTVDQPDRVPALESPLPLMTTTWTLNGESRSIPTLNSKVLTFSSVNTFTFSPASTSTTALRALYPNTSTFVDHLRWYSSATSQRVYIYNSGTDAISIDSTATFTSNGVFPVVKNFTPANKIINPGTTGYFDLSYYGATVGEFYNYILFKATSDAQWHKVSTEQQVSLNFNFRLDPPTSAGTITDYSERYRETFVFLTEQGEVASIEATTDNTAFQVEELTTSSVTISFNPNDLGYENGTYTSIVSVTANSITRTAEMTATIAINQSLFENYGTWVSPAAYDNSVIGISYDLINGSRYLTIGVGTGGDGTPLYSQGGQHFTATNMLGILAQAFDYDYFGWSTVYRFPVSDVGRYLSGTNDGEGNFSYKVKSTNGLSYEEYFGSESSVGSMFIVESDAQGNIEVNMNHLASLSGDTATDATLKNLSRAFYYYSTSDSVTRYYQLSPAPLLDGTVTELFRGFNSVGNVMTSIVKLPRSF